MQPLGAPADERIARRSPNATHAAVHRGLPWLLALGAVLFLQHQPLRWDVSSGQLRAGVYLAAIALGFAAGWKLFARDVFQWASWPPEGTLYARLSPGALAEVAAAWWQYLWLVPLATASTSIVAAFALLALVRPIEIAGTLYAADVVWRAVVAGGVGGVLAEALGGNTGEAITSRGIHISPVIFVPWDRFSHAVADRSAKVIRFYPRRRPWFVGSVMAFTSAQEYNQVLDLVAPYLRCLDPAEEPPRYRLQWRLFVGALALLVSLATIGTLTLLLLPNVLMSGGVAGTWLALALNQAPDITLFFAYGIGKGLDTFVTRLRGWKTKRIVSEVR